MNAPWLCAGMLLASANAAASLAVWRTATFEPAQKRLQFALIWLLPLIGAAACWYMARAVAREERHPGATQREGGNEDAWWNEPDSNEGSHHQHHDN